METTETQAFKPNLAVIEEYMRILTDKYEELRDDPFGQRARLAVRREIEAMRCFLEEHRMDETWKNLDAAFGIESGSRKPKPKTTWQIDESEPGPFRSKFSNNDVKVEDLFD